MPGGTARAAWRYGGNTAPQWQAIHGASATDVVAVDQLGGIKEWNGVTWTSTPSGIQALLTGVWVLDGSTGWIVGGAPLTGGTTGTVLKRTANGWVPHAGLFNRTFFAVHGSSATNVWAVGDDTVARVVNDTWEAQTVPFTNAGLRDVLVLSETDIWVVGGGAAATAHHYDGLMWEDRSPPTPPGAGTFASFALSQVEANGGSIWVLGTYVYSGAAERYLARWNGTGWTQETNTSGARAGVEFRGLWLDSPTSGWLVSRNTSAGGGGEIAYFGGTARVGTGASATLLAVWGSQPEDVFVVGSATYRYAPIQCPAGQHDGGSGFCVAYGSCTSGYTLDGNGNCI